MAGGLVLVQLNLIDEDPRNPRGPVGDVADLMQAIADRGQEDPIHIIAKGDGRYFLHEGHRRRAALTALGIGTAKAIVRRFGSDLDQLLSQGQMHAHRKQWDPMAWARYCHRLYWEHNLTRDDIARQLGVSQKWVRDHIGFMTLTGPEQRELESGALSQGEALHRLANRRAMRDGRPAPAGKTTPAAAVIPAQRQPRSEPHLNPGHHLADTVTDRCASHGPGHAARPKIGGVGCGQCWEDAIRDDALTAVRPVLAAA